MKYTERIYENFPVRYRTRTITDNHNMSITATQLAIHIHPNGTIATDMHANYSSVLTLSVAHRKNANTNELSRILCYSYNNNKYIIIRNNIEYQEKQW